MLARITPFAMLFAVPLAAQSTSPAPPPVSGPAPVEVMLTTSEGPIVVALDRAHAPVSTANFLRYVDAKRFDGTTFYRAMTVGPGQGLIQGGIKNDPKRLFPPIAHEPTTKTGLSHVAGTLSMARSEPGSARGDFFIMASDLTALDAGPAASGDKLGYAAFGHVVGGMDIVHRIHVAATSPSAGVGAMRGQMIAAPIRILTARRVVERAPR